MKKILMGLLAYLAMFYGFMFGAYSEIYYFGADALRLSFSIMFFGGFFTTKFIDKFFTCRTERSHGIKEQE
jgi:hypothetical protein